MEISFLNLLFFSMKINYYYRLKHFNWMHNAFVNFDKKENLKLSKWLCCPYLNFFLATTQLSSLGPLENIFKQTSGISNRKYKLTQ